MLKPIVWQNSADQFTLLLVKSVKSPCYFLCRFLRFSGFRASKWTLNPSALSC